MPRKNFKTILIQIVNKNTVNISVTLFNLDPFKPAAPTYSWRDILGYAVVQNNVQAQGFKRAHF